VLQSVSLFRAGYEELARRIFRGGTRPNLNRKNDYNDLHQLVYVNEFNQDVVVSTDGFLTDVGAPTGRVIAYADFLAQEDR
jgi:hypothetical protein